MLRSLAIACTLLTGAGALGSASAAPAPFDQVEISLWPEYDKPEVLVIYHLVLAQDAPLPASVALTLPAAVEKPHAVAYVGQDGGLYNAEYEVTTRGTERLVTVTLPERQAQIELYAPLPKTGARRAFTLAWKAPTPVAALSVSVQEPRGAQGLTLKPPASEVSGGGDGLTYHRAALGAVPAGVARTVELTYEKADDTLTASTLPPPSSPVPATPSAMVPASPDAKAIPQATLPQAETPTPGDDWFYFAATAVLALVLIGVWRGRGKA